MERSLPLARNEQNAKDIEAPIFWPTATPPPPPAVLEHALMVEPFAYLNKVFARLQLVDAQMHVNPQTAFD